MSRISNSFTIANAIVDLDLRRMSGNALKCYVVIVRKTTGWNKSSDRISIRQFQELAGIAKRDTVGKALRELEEMGLIIRHESYGKITTYSLNFDEPSPSSDDHTHPDERGDTHPDKRGTTKDTMTKDTSNKGSVCADAPPAPPEPDQPKPKRRSKADEFVAFLAERGVEEETARAWWKYHDGKEMTEYAWKRHCRQAEVAGISPQEAAAYAAERKWQGFYANSYLRDMAETEQAKQMRDRMAAQPQGRTFDQTGREVSPAGVPGMPNGFGGVPQGGSAISRGLAILDSFIQDED
ncbi:replication protein [uncultured Cardiobacterium sp.]|uniref:replication protein n=1 Tax=uncultured Cardiobacterium sp. TaxID=417619 RepID=UPI00260E9D18|nr:replication protein [uncultured Cardiobacterium sp.]